MRSGFQVIAVCTTGSQVLSTCEDLGGGILVCGYRFSDMLYEELRECLPASMEMLLIASPGRLGSPGPEGVVYLPMPLKVQDLLSTPGDDDPLSAAQKKAHEASAQGEKCRRAETDL